ncbi:hypothetical protein ACN22W_26240 [Burkholderia theae]|uniref:hypothetical protein n=1 Tax=Burkholderia theae TaxID=3143496 RepID=UPI003AFAA08E
MSLFVTIVPLLEAWVATADAGLKSTDDVAVIVNNETFYTDMFDDAAAFRFAELPVKRKPDDAVVKALLLGESQDGVPDGPNTLVVLVRQGERVYVLWKNVTVPGIAACGVGRVPCRWWKPLLRVCGTPTPHLSGYLPFTTRSVYKHCG